MGLARQLQPPDGARAARPDAVVPMYLQILRISKFVILPVFTLVGDELVCLESEQSRVALRRCFKIVETRSRAFAPSPGPGLTDR